MYFITTFSDNKWIFFIVFCCSHLLFNNFWIIFGTNINHNQGKLGYRDIHFTNDTVTQSVYYVQLINYGTKQNYNKTAVRQMTKPQMGLLGDVASRRVKISWIETLATSLMYSSGQLLQNRSWKISKDYCHKTLTA